MKHHSIVTASISIDNSALSREERLFSLLPQVKHHPLERFRNVFLKRVIDVSFSLLLLLCFSPVFLLVTILIKITSAGPVFFLQRRTGIDRKTFYCIKFRTMHVNQEAHRLQVQKDDHRITRIGKYLRRYFIDELPQLVNVIKGDMSLVGPRPHMLRHNVEFSKMVPNYHLRHKVKPGITGLSQMRGYHGMINTPIDLFNRSYSDFEYIEKWDILLDLEIMIRTALNILKRA